MCTFVDGQKTKKKSDKVIQRFDKRTIKMKDGACFAVLLKVWSKLANSVAPHSWIVRKMWLFYYVDYVPCNMP